MCFRCYCCPFFSNPRQMYERTRTGLAPEIVHFNTPDSWDDGDDDIIMKT